jgi:glycosyltransferase involved in cell wall biosynthesis
VPDHAAAGGSNGSSFSAICLSSQDWDEALPTNRQQIMTRAAARGHHVLFVETRGFLGKHLLRIASGPERRSQLRRLLGTEEVAPRVVVTKALNIAPWGQKYELARRLNARVTSAVLRRRAARLPAPALLWVYDPAAVPANASATWPIVYDCVDDYAEQTDGERRHALVARADEAVSRAASVVFATTRPLVERQQARNGHTHLVPNVGDYAHFVTASERSAAAPEIAHLQRPIVGFSGNFLAAKVDFDLLGRLAQQRRDWTFLLIGPAQKETQKRLAELASEPNISWLGPKPYAELPAYVAAFDVGLIPYVSNAYTQSCFPLKLYEYLAAGKPVVATGLPALADIDPEVVLTAGQADDVAAAIEAALSRSSEDARERRMSLAAQNTWESRVETLLELIERELRLR